MCSRKFFSLYLIFFQLKLSNNHKLIFKVYCDSLSNSLSHRVLTCDNCTSGNNTLRGPGLALLKQ